LPRASANTRSRTSAASAGNRALSNPLAAAWSSGCNSSSGQADTFEETTLPFPRRGKETDPDAGQAPGHETEHGSAHPVQPRQVIDDHQHRASRRQALQNCQGCVPDDQPIGAWCPRRTQRDIQRVPVRGIEPGELLMQWKKQLMPENGRGTRK